MKFDQGFHLQRRLKNENFSLISLTCLPDMFSLSKIKGIAKALETHIKVVAVVGFEKVHYYPIIFVSISVLFSYLMKLNVLQLLG